MSLAGGSAFVELRAPATATPDPETATQAWLDLDLPVAGVLSVTVVGGSGGPSKNWVEPPTVTIPTTDATGHPVTSRGLPPLKPGAVWPRTFDLGQGRALLEVSYYNHPAGIDVALSLASLTKTECASAERLVIDATGQGSVTKSHVSGERVYRFQVHHTESLNLTLATSGSALRGFGLVGPGCRPSRGLGVGKQYAQNTSLIRAPDLTPGEYFVYVVPQGTAASYTLAVTPVTQAPNTGCSGATPLTLVDGAAEVDVTTYSPAPPSGCDCPGTPDWGGDRFYRFSTFGLGPRSIRAELTFPGAGGSDDELLLQTGCHVCDGDPDRVLACVKEQPVDAIDLPSIPEGNYVLHVAHNPVFYHLALELGPPKPVPPVHDCSAPASLPLTAGTVTVDGDTRLGPSSNPGCPGTSVPWTGPDEVFRVAAPVPGEVSLAVDSKLLAFDPALAFGPTCDPAASPKAEICTDRWGWGEGEVIRTRVDPSHPMFLWIDSHRTPGARFQVRADFTPGSANDRCGLASPLAAGLGVWTGTGTGGAPSPGICASDATGDLTLWYRYTPAKDGPVTVTLVNDSATATQVHLSVGDGCGPPAPACLGTLAAAPDSAPGTLTFPGVAGRTYFIRVAGSNDAVFTLKAG